MTHKYTITESLDATLERYGIQPSIRWIKVRINDLPTIHHHLIVVLFNDGTVSVDFPENIDWLGAEAFGHIGY